MSITPYLITNVNVSRYTIYPGILESNRFMFSPMNLSTHSSLHNNVYFSCDDISVPILYKSPSCVNFHDEVSIQRLPLNMTYALNKKNGTMMSIKYSKPNFHDSIDLNDAIKEWNIKFRYEILVLITNGKYHYCVKKFGFIWMISASHPINENDFEIIKSTTHDQDYFMCVSYVGTTEIVGCVVHDSFFEDSKIPHDVASALKIVFDINDIDMVVNSDMTYLDLLNEAKTTCFNTTVTMGNYSSIRDTYRIEIYSSYVNPIVGTNVIRKMEPGTLPLRVWYSGDADSNDNIQLVIQTVGDIIKHSDCNECIDHIIRWSNLLKLNGGKVEMIKIYLNVTL